MLANLAQALEHFLTSYGYIAIFVMMFVEEAGVPLPLPNEVALMYAGYLAWRGDLNALLVSVVATLGAAGGSALLYAVARRGGRPLLRRFGRFIHLEEDKLDRAEHWVDRFGMISVPLARLTPGLRIYTTIIAGLLRVPYRIVIAAVVGASLIWSFFWVHLGYFLGENWEEGARAFERAGRWGIGVVVAVVVVALLVRWLLRRRARGRESPPPDDTPTPGQPRDTAAVAAHEEAALPELERRR
ncbi:MAG TPA: DedA family protein [Thermomicrobiales bacterium]|nr:DedA family protein [Thermomicrobiales bacterium]